MYHCDSCNYTTTRQFDYNRHLESNKHIKKNISIKVKKYKCEHCNKSYTFNSGLYRHMKCHEVLTLTVMNTNKAKDDKELDMMTQNNLLIEILRDNRELRRELLKKELPNNKIVNNIKQVNYNNVNQVIDNHIENQQINHINNQFNNHVSVNVFLNEKCKNAINLSEFIESIEITNETIEQCPNNGLIKNISEAFINALRQLDYYERPIHCSDKKRSTLYIKDNDKWDKDVEHEHMKDAIDNISFKHFMTLKEWVAKHPNFEKDDRLQAEYIAMANHITMDLTEKNNKPYKKIIQNVGQETYVSGMNIIPKKIEA
jgi:Zinc-finger of C2H2 type